MNGPEPSPDLLQVRATLHARALPSTARRLRAKPQALRDLSARAGEQVLAVLGAIDREHAGWALLSAGTMLAYSSDSLVPPIGGTSRDASVGAGLIWAGLMAALAGDDMIAAAPGHRAPSAAWEPGPQAPEALRLARRLADTMLGQFATPESRARFSEDALGELRRGLAGLDRRPDGWALLTLGVWIGSGADAVAAPLAGRDGLGRRRVADPARAAIGCSFAGALLAEIGTALLGDDAA